MSYLRRLLYRMRLIFPHINGLLSSYVPQILLQPVRIIARKSANRLVPHTAVHLHTFLLWNNHNQYKNPRTKRAALLQRCRMTSRSATKGLAAAVAKNGCFALQGKPFDSDKQRCCSGAENFRITICAAKWLRILRQRMLFPVMSYHSLMQTSIIQ